MIDLHLHLDGSLDAEEILYLASLSNLPLPATDARGLTEMLSVTGECKSLGEYLEKFQLPLAVLQTEEAIEHAVYSLIGKLSKQGLCYAEIRFAPQLHLQNGLTQIQVVAAAVGGLQKGNTAFRFASQLILCCMRGDGNFAENMETVKVAADYFQKGVCAIDLAGNEAVYATGNFQPVFAYAKERNVPFVIHAGEAAGPESVRAAVEFGAVRIGHGIRAVEDRELLALLREKHIPLELCYTSNLQTKAVQTPAEYPLMNFLEDGIAVTLNTDNMVVSNTSLKQEYQRIKDLYALNNIQLRCIAFHAVRGALVSETEKLQLQEIVENTFDAWMGQG